MALFDTCYIYATCLDVVQRTQRGRADRTIPQTFPRQRAQTDQAFGDQGAYPGRVACALGQVQSLFNFKLPSSKTLCLIDENVTQEMKRS